MTGVNCSPGKAGAQERVSAVTAAPWIPAFAGERSVA
jgi:hypothetical protein